MKRKILISALVLVVVFLAAGLIAKQVLVGYLTPDFVVQQIESRWNCRAEVDSVKVSLVGTATVRLEGVALAPRDEYADRGAPLAERPPLGEGVAELGSRSVLLEIRPAELIGRQLNIRHLVVDGLSIDTTINREGDATLESLFEEPAPSAGEKPAPLGETGGPAEAPGRESVERGDGGSEMKLATVADRIEVNEGTLSFHVEASGAEIHLQSFSLALTDIDIDPSSLDTHNRAQVEFGGDLVVRAPEGKVPEGADQEYLRAHITGNGRIQPFNPESGEIDPIWTAALTLHQGAEINTFPVIASLQRLLEDVDTAGVELSDLTIRGTLLADASTEIGHSEGKYLMKEPLELSLPDTTLRIERGSWIHTGTNEHRLQAVLVASETLTHQIEGKVDLYLEKKAGNFASENVRNLLLSPLVRDGRLTLEVSSKGDLAKPKVDIVTPLGNLSDVIGTGKDTLDSLEKAGKALLKNLFEQ